MYKFSRNYGLGMNQVLPKLNKVTIALLMAGSLQGCFDQDNSHQFTPDSFAERAPMKMEVQENYKAAKARFANNDMAGADLSHVANTYEANIQNFNQTGESLPDPEADRFPNWADIADYDPTLAYPKPGTMVKLLITETTANDGSVQYTLTPDPDPGNTGTEGEGETDGNGGDTGTDGEGETGGNGGDTGTEGEGETGGNGGDTGTDGEGETGGNDGDTGTEGEGETGGNGGDTGTDGEGETGGNGGDTGTEGEGETGGNGGDTGTEGETPKKQYAVFTNKWYANAQDPNNPDAHKDAPSMIANDGPWQMIAIADESGVYLSEKEAVQYYQTKATYDQGAVVKHTIEGADYFFRAKWWVGPLTESDDNEGEEGNGQGDGENGGTDGDNNTGGDNGGNEGDGNTDGNGDQGGDSNGDKPGCDSSCDCGNNQGGDHGNSGDDNTDEGVKPEILPEELPKCRNAKTTSYPEYVAGETYATGDIVINDGVIYRCKEGGWCSQAHNEPGLHDHWWPAAWEKIEGEVTPPVDPEGDGETPEPPVVDPNNPCPNGGNHHPVPILTGDNYGVPEWCSPWQLIDESELSDEPPKPDLEGDLADPPSCTTDCSKPLLPEGTPTVPPMIPTPLPWIPGAPTPLPLPEIGEDEALPEEYALLNQLTTEHWDWFFPLRHGKFNAEGGAFNGEGFAAEDGSKDILNLDAFKQAALIYNTWAKAETYPEFLNQESLSLQATEFAAFMAQVSRTTSGTKSGKAVTPPWAEEDAEFGVIFKGGLYNIQQSGFGPGVLGSIDGASLFKPQPKKSYHGRGPLHLTWNYNYGAFSEWLFSNGIMSEVITDKQTLLKQPELVAENGTIAMLSAIWQWMTPQGAKPSSHDVISGKITKVSESIKDLGLPRRNDDLAVPVAEGETTEQNTFAYRLGSITNIMNGGLECNKAAKWNTAAIQRVAYYNAYASYLKANIQGIDLPVIDTSEIGADQSVWRYRLNEESSEALKLATCYAQKGYYSWK